MTKNAVAPMTYSTLWLIRHATSVSTEPHIARDARITVPHL
jgi:hypothetical protein